MAIDVLADMVTAPLLTAGVPVDLPDSNARPLSQPEVRSIDIALDPLEGTTLTAKDMPNALTVIAMAPRGTLLHAPDVYMDKIAVGPGYPAGVVDALRAKVEEQGPVATDAPAADTEEPAAEAVASTETTPEGGDEA